MRLFLSAVRRFPRLVTTLALASVTLATFTACGPEEGTVLDKQHIPDRSYYTTVADYATSCTGSGTTRTDSTCVDSDVWGDLEVGEYWRKA